MPNSRNGGIASPHDKRAERQATERQEAGDPDPDCLHALPILDGRKNFILVCLDLSGERLDLVANLGINLARDCHVSSQVGNLVALLVKPMMDDGAAFMRKTLFVAEVVTQSVYAFLDAPES
ncbi:hypothetical protein SAMN05428953_12644 [Mesorhizobium muleiense]|uniref:Uncharacterized protein n=1 Tax=Mesorhizobium muleiense TaxID=1004279 RepID=A0A1G9H217_9HYPH|nr:hypothetical protein SAMN05428953_12644 [Mesorhizobium muleiense]